MIILIAVAGGIVAVLTWGVWMTGREADKDKARDKWVDDQRRRDGF